MGDRQGWQQVPSARAAQAKRDFASPPTEGPFIGTLAITLLSSIMQPEARRQTKKSVEKYHIDSIQYAHH